MKKPRKNTRKILAIAMIITMVLMTLASSIAYMFS